MQNGAMFCTKCGHQFARPVAKSNSARVFSIAAGVLYAILAVISICQFATRLTLFRASIDLYAMYTVLEFLNFFIAAAVNTFIAVLMFAGVRSDLLIVPYAVFAISGLLRNSLLLFSASSFSLTFPVVSLMTLSVFCMVIFTVLMRDKINGNPFIIALPAALMFVSSVISWLQTVVINLRYIGLSPVMLFTFARSGIHSLLIVAAIYCVCRWAAAKRD